MLEHNDVDADHAIDHIREALQHRGKLDPGTVITRAIQIVQTLTEHNDGTQTWTVHRLYPLGAMDPSTERGLLWDALNDSNADRHPTP